MVLLALVDDDYIFVWADVGNNGCCSHAQIFIDCQLRQSIMDRTIGFSDAELLPDFYKDMPYFKVADDAFVLRTWLMKPVSGRNLTDQQCIFNHRLSRATWVVDNVFRILTNHFRCLLTTIS